MKYEFVVIRSGNPSLTAFFIENTEKLHELTAQQYLLVGDIVIPIPPQYYEVKLRCPIYLSEEKLESGN
jgi:hypothetical protein